MKIKRRYSLILLLLLTVAAFLYGCGERAPADNVSDTKETINFKDIPDGTHRGTFTYGGFNYIVDVVAADGEIRAIEIVQNKDNEPSREAEAILDRIIEEQSLQVDNVSGATVSSRALLKAVENAVTKAVPE
ncbi:MAG: FMN-binding protein [Bacillota bacterium]|nr:FMN-binding protein [Bacillota bacterium]MDW7684852.1 FMN-binding protein [Bacillota bacterium]